MCEGVFSLSADVNYIWREKKNLPQRVEWPHLHLYCRTPSINVQCRSKSWLCSKVPLNFYQWRSIQQFFFVIDWHWGRIQGVLISVFLQWHNVYNLGGKESNKIPWRPLNSDFPLSIHIFIHHFLPCSVPWNESSKGTHDVKGIRLCCRKEISCQLIGSNMSLHKDSGLSWT